MIRCLLSFWSSLQASPPIIWAPAQPLLSSLFLSQNLLGIICTQVKVGPDTYPRFGGLEGLVVNDCQRL